MLSEEFEAEEEGNPYEDAMNTAEELRAADLDDMESDYEDYDDTMEEEEAVSEEELLEESEEYAEEAVLTDSDISG